MPRNGNGGYSLPNNSWNPAVNGTAATAADWQTLINDVAAAVQQSVSSDGQTTMTGSLKMGGFAVSGLGAPTGTGQSLRWEQLTKGADIASAASIAIPNEGSYFNITGTSTITTITDTYPGRIAYLKFSAGITLTNSVSLVLPRSTNILTTSGDIGIFVNDSPGVWICVVYKRGTTASDTLPIRYRTFPTITATNTSVTVGAGSWRSSDNSLDIVLASAITKNLQTSGAWAVGNNQNGLFTGARTLNSTYYGFVIRRDSDGVVDVGFDTSLTAANRPVGWSVYRRIWSVVTDASNNIRAFIQHNNECTWVTRVDVASGLNVTTSETLVPLTGAVPSGQAVNAYLSISAQPVGSSTGVAVYTPGQIFTTGNNALYDVLASSTYTSVNAKYVVCDTSRQVGVRANVSQTGFLALAGIGYIDLFED